MSENENENDERKQGIGDLAADAAHPFDQTNGLIDGLDGDADDPEKFNEKTEGETVLPAGGPNSGLPVDVPHDTSGESDDDKS